MGLWSRPIHHHQWMNYLTTANLYKKKKRKTKWISFLKCWLRLYSPSSQHPSSSPSTLHTYISPAGMRENVMQGGGEKMAWERLEIHSKLMGDKDNVLLIFCPITLWLMHRRWGTVSGAVLAHFTWWNCLFFCQNNGGQICVCCDSYWRGIVEGENQPLYNYAVNQIAVIVWAGWSAFVLQPCF